MEALVSIPVKRLTERTLVSLSTALAQNGDGLSEHSGGREIKKEMSY